MPKGPEGQKRPADTMENAVMVARIATGEIEEELPGKQREGGLIGGPARAEALTEEERTEIARKAAEVRWNK